MDERSAESQLDGRPDPVLASAVEAHDARVTATNEAFERQFAETQAEPFVSTIFERFRSHRTPVDQVPLTHLVRGDHVGSYLDGYGDRRPFSVRVIPADENTSYLVFSDPQQYPDVDDPTQ